MGTPSSLGGLVAEGLESTVNKTGIGKDFVEAAERFFSPNSTLTGKAGGFLKDVVEKRLYPEQEFQKSVLTKTITASGLPIEPSHISSKAMQNAADNVFGTHREHLAPILHAIRVEQGPHKAIQAMNSISDILGETASGQPGFRTSHTVSEVVKHPIFKNAPVNFEPSKYQKQQPIESAISKYATMAMAPTVATWHATQALLMSSVNAHAYSMMKAAGEIFGTGFHATKAQLRAFNALGSDLLDEYSANYAYNQGVLKKLAPGSISEFLSKNYMLPGLPAVKSFNMVYSAMVGKWEAKYAADQLLKGGSGIKYGQSKLAELGINFNKVAQQGTLHPDDVRIAMQRMIQMNLYPESRMGRSRMAVTTPFGRIITLFHNYAIATGNSISRQVFRSLRGENDPAMVLQQIIALGVLFPSAGFLMDGVNKAIKGSETPSEAVDEIKKREVNYLEGKNFADGIMMLGRMGAGGLFYDYSNAALRNKLAEFMLGPIANQNVELIEDGIKASPLNPSRGEHKADQFKRDIIRAIPSYGQSTRLAHHFYPTSSERAAQRPVTARSLKARQAAARRKAKRQ